MSINVYTVAAGLGIIGLILAIVSLRIRQMFYYIISHTVSQAMFVFVRRTYLHRSLGDAFIAHLTRSGYKVKRFAGELYGEDPAFIRSENESKHILYRDFSGSTQLFYGRGWPIFISGTPLIQVKDNVKRFSYVAYTFRWSIDITRLLDEATEEKNDGVDDVEIDRFVVKRVSGGRFFKEAKDEGGDNRQRAELVNEVQLADPFSAFVPVKWEKSNIGEQVNHNTLDMMSLNPELEDALEEIKFWFSAREWYEERQIPWKRGMLFYGKPGTGKTLFSRALAEKLNVPLIIFDLASMNNTEFIDAWSKLLPKRIALFEDFDAVFHKRDNILNSDLSFDCILNVLDGADKKQGVLTILTTNHPETLDPALGGPNNVEDPGKIPTRPGRIDRSVEFLPLDHAGRFKLAMRIVQNEKLANELIELGKNDSAAQLQERCFRAAIEVLFQQRSAAKAAKLQDMNK